MVKIAHKEANTLGFGLMGLTWRSEQTADSIAFPLLKEAIESGCTFWNSGEFYGSPDPTLNLQLLNRYFSKYPEDRSKVFLSVKGCIFENMTVDISAKAVRRSVENSCKVLGSYIDLFQPARVDDSTPIEETMKTLNELIDEGKIRSIGLSECGPQTIRRASKVGKVAAVEQEYSLWSTEIETNGVVEACKELQIPLIAYSPLGRGFLTGQVKSRADLAEGDMRLHLPRFSPENFDNNLKLVQNLKTIAQKKGIESSQLAIAWVLAQQNRLGIEILPIPGCVSVERFRENLGSKDCNISQNELKEIQITLDSVNIMGGRYPPAHASLLFGESPETARKDS